MWPFTHLAIGYLLYSIYTHGRFRRAPGGPATLILAFGTQLPDLIDKPLAWAGILPYGRSLGHSLLITLPIIVIGGFIIYMETDIKNDLIVAFGIGYIAHPIFDTLPFFLQGSLAEDFYEISFVVWPLTLPGQTVVDAITITAAIEALVFYKEVWTAQNLPPASGKLQIWLRLFEVGIMLLTLGIWLYDGKPGWKLIRRTVERNQTK